MSRLIRAIFIRFDFDYFQCVPKASNNTSNNTYVINTLLYALCAIYYRTLYITKSTIFLWNKQTSSSDGGTARHGSPPNCATVIWHFIRNHWRNVSSSTRWGNSLTAEDPGRLHYRGLPAIQFFLFFAVKESFQSWNFYLYKWWKKQQLVSYGFDAKAQAQASSSSLPLPGKEVCGNETYRVGLSSFKRKPHCLPVTLTSLSV